MSDENELTPALSRVREIATKRLFGLYDHVVPLFLDDRVTIVHGANGVGKTVLLKLVHALFSQDYVFLLSVPYEELSVTLVDGTKICIIQIRAGQASAERTDDTQGVSTIRILATVSGALSPIDFQIRSDQFNFERWAQQLAASTSWLHAAAPDRYFDMRNELIYSAAELWRLFSSESVDRQGIVAPEIPREFQALIGRVKTYLVDTQRLMRLSTKAPRTRRTEVPVLTPAVVLDAQDLGARIRDAFTQYGRESQKRDQTFPQRLFDLPQTMSREEIKNLLAEIEGDQARLAKLGILDVSPTYPFSPSILDRQDEAKLDAMDLFVRDTKEKLRPLLEFASRVEPLLSNINSKFKNKVIRLDREKGLMARAVDGSEIRPDQLSSGEQHEIVLLFHLLFRISPNTLVLIDEPELSLHIDWQRQVLPELLSIAGRSQIDALVATHSPFIAGERDDLMIDLDSTAD